MSMSGQSLRYMDASAFEKLDRDLLLSDLDSCVVNLLSQGVDIHAVHVQNLRNTVLLLPAIQGSILLHNLHRCIVMLGCHQVE